MRELPDHLETQSLLAGTLCLMSCPNSSGAPMYVRRIVANLERLASHPALTAEMRSICRRLAAQWEERLLGQEPPDRGTAPVH